MENCQKNKYKSKAQISDIFIVVLLWKYGIYTKYLYFITYQQ